MLDVREAAALARRSSETVRRWVWSGRLPATRVGRKLLVARRDVEQIMSGGATPTPEPQLSLREWARLVKAERARHGRRGAPGTSAADLVLADRRERSAS